MDADLDYMFIFKWFRQNKQLNNPVPVGTGNVIRVLTRYFPLLSICSLFHFSAPSCVPNPTLTLLESLLPQGQKQVWLSVKDA